MKLSVHPIEAFKVCVFCGVHLLHCILLIWLFFLLQTGSRSVSVELESDPGRSVDSSVTNDAGVFCFMLAPGKYALKVRLRSLKSLM